MRHRALRVTLVALVCLAAPLAFSPGAALAAPPVFASITVTGGQATVKWSLPPCVHAIAVETSTANTTKQYGYFTDDYSFDAPRRTDTSLVISDTKDPKPGNFPPGTYYVHVGGQDESRPPPILPEFSDAVPFTVDASGNGCAVGVGPPAATAPCPVGSGGGGGGGGGGIVTKVAPFGSLSYTRIQSIRKLFVIAHTTEAGTLKAVGSVRIPGSAKLFKFRTVSRKVRASGNVKLRLRLSKKNLRLVQGAIRRAKKKGKQLKANVTVTATNGAGAARSQSASIKLKP